MADSLRDPVTGRLELPPVVYKRTEHGWLIPPEERAEWDALADRREQHAGVYSAQKLKSPIAQEARPLQQLIVELEEIMLLEGELERQVRDAYLFDDASPLKMSRLVDDIRKGYTEGRVTSPAGLLVKKLRGMVS